MRTADSEPEAENDTGCEFMNLKKRFNSAGFSFAELLVTILILTLVSGGMARGVAFARDQYRKSMILSESKTLCSTLSDIIKDELRNATNYKYENDTVLFTSHELNVSDCRFYIPEGTEYGELWLGLGGGTNDPKNNRRLISTAAYSAHKLKAKVEISCDNQNNATGETVFHVKLEIWDAQKSEVTVSSEFDVIPLNPS